MEAQIKEANTQNKPKTGMMSEPEIHCEIQLTGESEMQLDAEKVISDCKRFLASQVMRYSVLMAAFCLILYIQGLLIITSDSYYVPGTEPLKDRIHELVNPIQSFFTIRTGNLMIGLLAVVFLIRICVFYPYVLSVQVFTRFMLLESILYLTRGIFIILTTVPSPYDRCYPGPYETHWAVIKAIILGYLGVKDPCTDVIISGHTMTTVMISIFLIHHCRMIILNIFIAVYTIFVLFFIVSSKYHYTIDVLFGAIFALTSYFVYFTHIDQYGKACIREVIGNEKEESSCGIIHKIICFLENVPQKIRLGHRLSQIHTSIQNNEIEGKKKTEIEHMCQKFGVLEMKDLSELYRGNKGYDFYYIDLVTTYFKRKRDEKQKASTV